MAGGSRNGEEMPDEMAVLGPGEIKNHADRVREPPGKQPEQAVERQVLVEGADHQHNHPAHAQIEDEGNFGMPQSGNQLGDDSQNGEAPDQAEDSPSQSAPQDPEGEGHVGTGDQKKNPDVVEDVEDSLRAVFGQRVIHRGTQVEENHGCSKNGNTHGGCSIAFVRCGHNQDRSGGQCRDEGQAVADAVGDFFTQRLLSVIRQGCEGFLHLLLR